MKQVFKWIGVVLVVLVIVIVVLIFAIAMPSKDKTQDEFTKEEYSYIMEKTIHSNARVIDISMLGAHDAFTHKIDKNAEIDPHNQEMSMLNNKTIKAIGGGLMARLSKAQKSDAYTLLSRGVRYFDVRVTYHNQSWQTVHSFISAPFEEYLKDVLKFLSTTTGEIVVFDMQHVYVGNASMEALFSFIDGIKYNGKSLLDYIYYNPKEKPLSSLRYTDVTKNGSGVVILAKTNETGDYNYEYFSSIRSIWHSTNSNAELLSLLELEIDTLRINPELAQDQFRVAQAQRTSSFAISGLPKTIKSWSLLDMGEEFNAYLIQNKKDIKSWFSYTPIIMVDYADSMEEKFNDKIMQYICEFNEKLT